MNNAQETQAITVTSELRETKDVVAYEAVDKDGNPTIIPSISLSWTTHEHVQKGIDELIAEGRKNIQFLTFDEFDAIEAKFAVAIYKLNIPQEISLSDFKERFNALPPANHVNYENYESFFIMTSLTTNIYSAYVRIGKGESATYYEVNTSRNTTAEQLFNLCEQQKKAA